MIMETINNIKNWNKLMLLFKIFVSTKVRGLKINLIRKYVIIFYYFPSFIIFAILCLFLPSQLISVYVCVNSVFNTNHLV